MRCRPMHEHGMCVYVFVCLFSYFTVFPVCISDNICLNLCLFAVTVLAARPPVNARQLTDAGYGHGALAAVSLEFSVQTIASASMISVTYQLASTQAAALTLMVCCTCFCFCFWFGCFVLCCVVSGLFVCCVVFCAQFFNFVSHITFVVVLLCSFYSLCVFICTYIQVGSTSMALTATTTAVVVVRTHPDGKCGRYTHCRLCRSAG